MSIFKNLFHSNAAENEQKKLNWIPLNELDQLNSISELSKNKPVLIFKHSTRCGISRMALKTFENSFNINEEDLDIYYLDLLQFRGISNEIVAKFNVQHQSPQAIVISKGKVVYNDSHYEISVEGIKKAIS